VQLFSTTVTSSNSNLRNQAPLFTELRLLQATTFCFAILGHLNTKNSKIDATETYETR